MTILSCLWHSMLRRGRPYCLAAVLVGLAGCKNCDTNPTSGSTSGNPPAADGRTEKQPPRSDGADGLWLNSDKAKDISHDLDRITD